MNGSQGEWWDDINERSKMKEKTHKMKFRTRVPENGKVVSKDAWVEKTHLEQYQSEITNLDTMFSENDIIVSKSTCGAILKDKPMEVDNENDSPILISFAKGYNKALKDWEERIKKGIK